MSEISLQRLLKLMTCVSRGDCVCQPLQPFVGLQHDAPCYQGQDDSPAHEANKQCLCKCPDHASVLKFMPAPIRACSKQL